MKNKKNIFIIGLLILIVCIVSIIIYMIVSSGILEKEKLNNKENIKYEEKEELDNNSNNHLKKTIVAIASFTNQTDRLFGITEKGDIKDYNIRVLSTDGVGSRSFDVYNNVLYYIDKEYKLHRLNLGNDKENVFDLKDKISDLDRFDIYASDKYVIITDEDEGYAYDYKNNSLKSFYIDSPYSANMRYFNRKNNTLYYESEGYNINSYNIDTSEEEYLFSDYALDGDISNSEYLVYKKESSIYLYNYETKKSFKLMEKTDANDTLIKLNGTVMYYTKDNKIMSKNLNGEESILFELEMSSNFLYVAFNRISFDNEVFLETYISPDCSYLENADHGICPPERENVYLFNLNDKKIVDISNNYKELYFDEVVLN